VEYTRRILNENDCFCTYLQKFNPAVCGKPSRIGSSFQETGIIRDSWVKRRLGGLNECFGLGREGTFVLPEMKMGKRRHRSPLREKRKKKGRAQVPEGYRILRKEDKNLVLGT